MDRYVWAMGEHAAQVTFDRSRANRKQPKQQTAAALGRSLLETIVYRKNCRIGGYVSLDDLDTTDIGDWKMSDYKAACAYAASQGWLSIENDILTLTTAGLAAA
ncbi:MAG TPA: hypothetical protein VMB73_15350 [Acetobacteraceae bacterium]|jgi:hypothetical protein|nr:hypothetical protein [Acetobacteraceae bacterium]